MVETSAGRPSDCLVQTLHCVDEEMAAQGCCMMEPGDRLHYLLFWLEPKAQLESRCQMEFIILPTVS